MKAIILCAGYATRLYPLTLDRPKPLLPLADKPMLDYIFERVNKIDELDTVYIVTNQKFYEKFKEWANTKKSNKKIVVINDGTLTNETRLGAIGDMKFVIDSEKIDDDLLVIAGDNIFFFDLNDFISFSKRHGTSVVAKFVENIDLMKKYSQLELDENNRIISFEEKPQNPKTNLAAICIYYFPKEKLKLIDRYLSEGNPPDPPGKYIEWLVKHENVYGFVYEGKWYDIGDKSQYEAADKEFREMFNITS